MEVTPALTTEFEAGGLPLPVLEVELNGEAFEKLRERMGGTEVECLLRIKQAPMPDQITLTGTVQSLRRIRGDWGACELRVDGKSVRATGDVVRLSRGDAVQALGRWRETKWGSEFQARAIIPVVLLPALAEIEAVTDRFQPRRPARGAILGLVITLGKQAAKVMANNPFLPVVDPDREVSGWGYGSAAQYADLVGIPADAEVRATAAVTPLVAAAR